MHCLTTVCAPELELTFGDMAAGLLLVARRQHEDYGPLCGGGGGGGGPALWGARLTWRQWARRPGSHQSPPAPRLRKGL